MNTEKREQKNKKIKIITCIALYLSFAVFLASLFLFNLNYQKIYDSPEVVNGEADFTDVKLSGRGVACNLAGEWNFYYDKWIVTDGYTGEPDGLINLPSVWTYKNYGGKTLPKTGYASYKITVYNVAPGESVLVFRDNENFAYRSFINGKLCVRRGTLSKEVSSTEISNYDDEVYPYITDGSPLEIVIELSATDTAGLNLTPWIEDSLRSPVYGTALKVFSYFALGFSLCAVTVSILSFLFFSVKRDWTMPAFMVLLFLHFVVSKDMMYIFNISYGVSGAIRFASAILALCVFLLHLVKNKTKIGKTTLIVTLSLTAVLTVLTAIFFGTPLCPVFAITLFAIFAGYIYFVTVRSNFSPVQTICYGVLYSLLLGVFWFELCDFLGLLVFGTEFLFCLLLMIMLVFFAVLWMYKISSAAREAMRVNDLEKQLVIERNKALKAQIKPHFIYNSLTAIQARYQKNTVEGDKAIERFAEYLRLVTDSDKVELIPFEDEINNVLNYFELENLRLGDKIQLFLDLDFTDFFVPVLSLQPLVENAVRHGISENEGYIEITSYKEGDYAVVTVKDNGKGFDVKKETEGVGLKNTAKRFAQFNYQFKISSSSSGTLIEIIIPLKQNYDAKTGL